MAIFLIAISASLDAICLGRVQISVQFDSFSVLSNTVVVFLISTLEDFSSESLRSVDFVLELASTFPIEGFGSFSFHFIILNVRTLNEFISPNMFCL